MTLFTHDCHLCIPLGEHEGHDLYFCRQNGIGPTVVARYGNKGHEYTSGLGGASLLPELAEARKRAQAQGLLS